MLGVILIMAWAANKAVFDLVVRSPHIGWALLTVAASLGLLVWGAYRRTRP